MKKIKVVPRKSKTLCDKCKFGRVIAALCIYHLCDNCKMNNAGKCICVGMTLGKPCNFFERVEEHNEKD